MTPPITPPFLPSSLIRFVTESNAIEGINREPFAREINAHLEVLESKTVTVELLKRFVKAVQPGAKLRSRKGMNVRVRGYVAPMGGPGIKTRLTELLANPALDAYQRHLAYEQLHPFQDGNGRSGRVLWLHDMGGLKVVELGFLHTFYYQTLREYAG